MPFSTTSANALLNHFLRNSSDYPTNHFALYSDVAATSEIVTIARQPCPSFSVPSSGSTTTLADVDFGDAPASLTIRAWAIVTAASSGSILFWDVCRDNGGNAVERAASGGDPISIFAGSLTISPATSL